MALGEMARDVYTTGRARTLPKARVEDYGSLSLSACISLIFGPGTGTAAGQWKGSGEP